MPRIDPGSIGYETLYSDVEIGRIKIPQFQRDFVWSKEQTANLIDSNYQRVSNWHFHFLADY